MGEKNKGKSQKAEPPSVVVDISIYRKESTRIDEEMDPGTMDYSAGILRFIDSLILDMVRQDWKGKEVSE